MIPRVQELVDFKSESHDVFTMVLSGDGSGFQPGQFNMLYAFGVGEVPISISGDPTRHQEVVHTIRAVGAVTEALGALRKGARVGVRGPFGRPWPLEEARGKDVLVVAGGIGLAPVRPVLYQLARNRKDYGRATLLLGARTPKDILFLSELKKMSRAADIALELTVDHADRSWRGNVGVVPALIPKLGLDAGRTTAIMCGPEVMMRFAATALAGLGVAEDAIFLSMERNMKCGIGLCGHCQWLPHFVCKDGPVFSYAQARPLLERAEL